MRIVPNSSKYGKEIKIGAVSEQFWRFLEVNSEPQTRYNRSGTIPKPPRKNKKLHRSKRRSRSLFVKFLTHISYCYVRSQALIFSLFTQCNHEGAWAICLASSPLSQWIKRSLFYTALLKKAVSRNLANFNHWEDLWTVNKLMKHKNNRWKHEKQIQWETWMD